MKTVLVTGAEGFIGKNLCSRLEQLDDLQLIRFTRKHTLGELTDFVNKADFIFHLAGINRPQNETEFTEGNVDLTKHLVDTLRMSNKKTSILLSSSAQATQDNPYGKSKLAAENLVLSLHNELENPVYIYRLPGVFGKWCKPNYNSVVATFCNNIARGLPVQVSDPLHKITLAYIDDVIDSFIDRYNGISTTNADSFYAISQTFEVSLADLKDRITAFHDLRTNLVVPDLSDVLNKYLYATYVAYLKTDNFGYEITANVDERGWLAEFIKSNQFGQIFVSKTKPGISRGNHWHHTKIEKFLVVEGKGEISFRNKINDQDVIKYNVDGDTPTVLDIPTGYVHAIKNIGKSDLITIFWANEILDKDHPDTYYEKVEEAEE